MAKGVEKKTEIRTTVTPIQKKKIMKLADKDVLSTSAFVRKTLVKTLKLKEE